VRNPRWGDFRRRRRAHCVPITVGTSGYSAVTRVSDMPFYQPSYDRAAGGSPCWSFFASRGRRFESARLHCISPGQGWCARSEPPPPRHFVPLRAHEPRFTAVIGGHVRRLGEALLTKQ